LSPLICIGGEAILETPILAKDSPDGEAILETPILAKDSPDGEAS
jgi:hypothetical protein